MFGFIDKINLLIYELFLFIDRIYLLIYEMFYVLGVNGIKGSLYLRTKWYYDLEPSVIIDLVPS